MFTDNVRILYIYLPPEGEFTDQDANNTKLKSIKLTKTKPFLEGMGKGGGNCVSIVQQ
jgi:hypothetical protein